MRILDGRAVAAEIRREVAIQAREFAVAQGRPPSLAAVLVGDDPASRVYVATKTRACSEIGIFSRVVSLPADCDQQRLTEVVRDLNDDQNLDGILVQLPLPRGIAEQEVLELVDPGKDVDGFHPHNVGRLWSGGEGFVPATPIGILELLRRCEIPLAGRRAVIVGRSNIVGRPLAGLLLRADCTVTLCHSRTADLVAVCREADILVAAIGRPGLIGTAHVRPGAVVVDVGINRVTAADEVARLFPGDEQKRQIFARQGYLLAGDVDFARVAPIAGAITPVPGGVGPLTVAMLLVNTLRAAQQRSI